MIGAYLMQYLYIYINVYMYIFKYGVNTNVMLILYYNDIMYLSNRLHQKNS